MCEDAKKAMRKRTLATKFEIARKSAPTDFDIGKKNHHPDYCVKAEIINLLAEDREETLREQALEHEERAKRNDAGTFARAVGTVAENYPAIIILALFIAADKLLPIVTTLATK